MANYLLIGAVPDQVLGVGDHDLRVARINALSGLCVQFVDQRLLDVAGSLTVARRISLARRVHFGQQGLCLPLILNLAGRQELRDIAQMGSLRALSLPSLRSCELHPPPMIASFAWIGVSCAVRWRRRDRGQRSRKPPSYVRSLPRCIHSYLHKV